MKHLKKVASISSIEEIPWGKQIIVSGCIGYSFWWKMTGTFTMTADNRIKFTSRDGTVSFDDTDNLVSLSILEEVEEI